MRKRIVVCCDGTWNTANQTRGGVACPTNVAKIKAAVAEQDADGVRQVALYQPGVGTNRWERLRGGAFGVGLSRNILAVYRELIEIYEPGDEIFVFGFSRGAYTARSLAGLVRKSGILQRGHAARISEAWSLYRRSPDKPTDPGPTRFRDSYSFQPRMHFIGVWDTVGELGVPVLGPRWIKPIWRQVNKRWSFHDTTLNSQVNGAFQALAVDEQRSVFEPTLWHQQPDTKGQELQQLWFTGVHCGIGGGLTDSRLSDIALHWMADQARRYGLEFSNGAFDGLDPQPLADFGPSRTGIYRLTRPFHRPIGKAVTDGRLDGFESVAEPVVTRHATRTDYRPPELERYLEDQGNVHVTPVQLPSGWRTPA